MLVYDPLVWLPVSGVVLALALLLYVRRYSEVPVTKPFQVLVFICMMWCLCDAINVSITDLDETILITELTYVFSTFISVAVFMLVIEVTGRRAQIGRKTIAALLVVPIITVVLALTMRYHTLFMYDFSVTTTVPTTLLFQPGIWFYVEDAYTYLLVGGSMLLFIESGLIYHTLFRKQGALMLGAFFLPFIFSLLQAIGIVKFPALNIAPAIFIFSGVLLAWAIYRYRFLDIQPIARSGMIDSMADALLAVDMEGRLIDNNRPAEYLLKRPTKAAAGQHIDEILPFGERLSALIKESIPRGEVTTGPGEGERVYEATVTPVLVSNEPRGHMVLLRDVTDLKKAQDDLRRSEERFRQVADIAGEFIWETDGAGYYTYCSPAVERILGYRPEDIVKVKRSFDLLVPEHRGPNTAAFRDAMARKAPIQNLINEKYHRDGRVVILQTSAVPVIGKDGGVGGYRGTDLDVTEQKQVETRLRRSEERYRNMLESAPFPIVISSLPEGHPILFNQASLDYFKVPDVAMRGQVVKDFFMDVQDRNDLLSTILTRGRVDNAEVQMRDMEGRTFWTNISATLIEMDGRKAVFSMHSYIEERRRATEALRSANAKLNLLSTITRHDLINNLTATHGYIHLAQQEADPTKVASFLEQLDNLARSADALVQFTKDYQDLGVVAPLWQDVQTTARMAASQLSLPSTMWECRAVGISVLADPMLVKVFYNLMENSVRHGGKVSRIVVSAEQRGGDQIISVEDDGAGIPEQDKDTIFLRGFGKNSGLGLFLTKEILAITGLTIREVGEEGVGARFEIAVPRSSYRFAPQAARTSY